MHSYVTLHCCASPLTGRLDGRVSDGMSAVSVGVWKNKLELGFSINNWY